MRIKTLLLFIFILGLYSCDDDDLYETSIKGHVYTNGTTDFPGDQPIPVLLIEQTEGSGLSAGERIRETTYTDLNGYYEFNFESDGSDHWVRIDHKFEAPLHFTSHHGSVGGYPVNVGSEQTIDLTLSPYAWLDLHIENVNPVVGDVIRFRLISAYELNGPVNTNVLEKLGGNNMYNFGYSVIRNNVPTRFEDSVYLTAFDTTFHKIEY